MEVLYKAFIYLPITNQPTNYVKESFAFLKSLDLVGSVAMEEIDLQLIFYFSCKSPSACQSFLKNCKQRVILKGLAQS